MRSGSPRYVITLYHRVTSEQQFVKDINFITLLENA